VENLATLPEHVVAGQAQPFKRRKPGPGFQGSAHNVDQYASSDEQGSPQPAGDVYALHTMNNHSQPIVVTVKVIIVDLPMELDTGASHKVISEKTYKQIGGTVSKLQSSKVSLFTYTGEKLIISGSAMVQVKHNNQTQELPLVVLKKDGPTLLGRNWLEKIRID
jgi:hypothetical protein